MTNAAMGAAPPLLFSQDLTLILKLAARASVVVGDIPVVFASMQRLEVAANLNQTYAPVEAPPVEPESDADGNR